MPYDNTNRGQIWKNDKKETDNHPDFKGSLNVDGEEYWISAWKRKSDANPNSPALKFAIRKKDSQPRQASEYTKEYKNKQDDFYNDDVPF